MDQLAVMRAATAGEHYRDAAVHGVLRNSDMSRSRAVWLMDLQTTFFIVKCGSTAGIKMSNLINRRDVEHQVT